MITLPGNPVSSYVSFEMFVLPAIRTLMGLAPAARPMVTGRLTHGLSSPDGRRQYMRGEVGYDAQGRFVTPVGGPASHLIGDLATSNCLIEVPADVTSIDAGEMVAVRKLDEEF